MATSVLFLNDPPLGINDEIEDPTHPEESTDEDSEQSKPRRWDCAFLREGRDLLRNPFFLSATLGSVAISFALGGLTEWYPTFLVRYSELSQAQSGLVLSGSCVLSGIGGNVLGGKVADGAARRFSMGSSSYFLVPAVFMLPSAILIAVAVNHLETWCLVVCLILGEMFFFCYQAPIAALSMSVIPVHSRARGSSLQILLGHVLGDVISPPIIGFISDSMDLKLGLQVTWVAVIMAGLLWFAGYCCLEKPPIDIVPKQQKDSGTISYILQTGRESVCGCESDSSSQSS